MANITGFRTEGELALGYWIWMIATPILIVLGNLGNVLTLLVLCRKQMLRNHATMYLVCLAVMDILRLDGVALPAWLIELNTDLNLEKSSVGCPLFRFVTHNFPEVSAWILSVLSIERVIAVKWPLHYKTICTKKSTYISLSAIAVISLITNGHFLIGYGYDVVDTRNDTVEMACAPILDYGGFLRVWPFIFLIKAVVVPIVIMSGGSIFIAIAILLEKRGKAVQLTCHSARKVKSPLRSVTLVLLALNIAFIGTTVPLSAYLVTTPFFYTMDIPFFLKRRDPMFAALLQLTYLNHAINFLLYHLTGSQFRSELKTMVVSLKPRFCTPKLKGPMH